MTRSEDAEPEATATAGTDVFAADEVVGRDLALVDWAATTPLGDPEGWPQSLKTTVSILLSSKFSMWMAWGPELTFFCNAAYRRDTLGRKYPWALGRPASEVWAEIWDDIGPRIDTVLTTGEATWDQALLLFVERSGYPEESYHTFSYSPLRDDDGQVVGMLCVVSEETDRVIGERRMATLRDLGSDPSVVRTEQEMLDFARLQLSRNPRDLPFTLTYLFHEDGSAALAAPPAYATTTPPRCGSSRRAPRRCGRRTPRPGASPRWCRWTAPCSRTCPRGSGPTAPSRHWWCRCGSRGHPVRIHGRRPEPVPGPGRRIPRLRGTGRRARRHRSRQRPQLPGAAAARRGTRRTGPGEDGLLLQHQPRVPHPLTLIMGPVDELRERLADADAGVREELEVVHRNGLRLGKLVNTLLDFSRIEAGRMQAGYEPVDLAEVTGELASVFRSAVDRAAWTSASTVPRCPSRSSSTGACGRKSSSTCSATR